MKPNYLATWGVHERSGAPMAGSYVSEPPYATIARGVPMKPWKTCLASVPDEVDPEIAKYAATMVTCASIFICLTDKDAATHMTEFLCPLCGALVRRYSKPIGLYAETETPDYYNPIFGHCPLGKSVHLILVNCPACSAGFKE